MKTDRTQPKNIDEYIAGFPQVAQDALERVRSAIRKAVPGAEEAISYNMPTYKLRGQPVIYFAGWKRRAPESPRREKPHEQEETAAAVS